MKTPAIFVAHGAPPLLDDARWMSELNAWARALPAPRAVLMLSAHWEERPITLGATTTMPLVYDFYGFPARYYEQRYPAPGAPELAKRIHETLEPVERVVDEPARGLDHGAYVPLVAMYPKADVPTLQVSLPSMDPTELFSLGQRLAPLRDEGVLILGSGNIIHNLHSYAWGKHEVEPFAWAVRFETLAKEFLIKRNDQPLVNYEALGRDAVLSAPTPDHYLPLLYVLGSGKADDEVTFPVEGFDGG